MCGCHSEHFGWTKRINASMTTVVDDLLPRDRESRPSTGENATPPKCAWLAKIRDESRRPQITSVHQGEPGREPRCNSIGQSKLCPYEIT